MNIHIRFSKSIICSPKNYIKSYIITDDNLIKNFDPIIGQLKMTSFKSTTISTLPSLIEPLTDSAKFWKNNLQPAKVYKELNSINYIDLNENNELLATSCSKIILYDPMSWEQKRAYFSPNRTSLFCGVFRRQNSNVFATGSGDGMVRLWTHKKSKPIRILGMDDNDPSLKHSAAIHRVEFNKINQIFSCGDDKHIKLWDFTQSTVLSQFGSPDGYIAHKDYIRASCLIENSSLLVSGSYDHTVKVWDHRSPQNSCFEFNHDSPVESLTYRDLLIISSSGSTVQIFDVVAGKCLRKLERFHHKTITAVFNYGSYLLTASIDGHLKIFDVNFNVSASFSYSPSQILSCCYNGMFLAIGTNDGILSVNKVSESQSKKRSDRMKDKSINRDEDISIELFFNNVSKKSNRKKHLDLTDTFVVQNADLKPKEEKHEILLRKFQYSSALTRVMKVYYEDDAQKVVNFMQELIRRNALRSALAGRNIKSLARIIKFLTNFLGDIRFTRILLDVSLMIIDVYSRLISREPKLRILFKELSNRVDNEIECIQKMSEISGQLKFLINTQIK